MKKTHNAELPARLTAPRPSVEEPKAKGKTLRAKVPAWGVDEGTSVTEAYRVPVKFTGTIQKVTIELKEMTAAHAEEEKDAVREAHERTGLAD